MVKPMEINRFAKGIETVKSKRTNDCVIYTRVSTKEQADNNMSLETQRKGCEAYVLKQKYNVLAYFGGTYESAQTDEGKEFGRMITFCKKQKSKVSYIIVYSLERFSRTGDNAIWLSRQLRELGITIISVTQPIDTSNPAGVLQQNILFLFSQYDNDLRKQKSMEGTKEKLMAGIWCTKPPLGYDSVKRNGERAIEINATGKLLRKAYLWKANEGLGNSEIVSRLLASGLKTTQKRLHDILKNPFYCGMLSHTALGGEIIKGKHEALDSQDIFLKANDTKPRNYGVQQNPEYEMTPLRGLYKCETCGENLRGYIVRKKGLYYYKCNSEKRCACNKSAKELHKQFSEILSELSIQEEYTEPLKEQLRLIYSEVNEAKDKANDDYHKQIRELEKKVERLEERFINEEVKPELYEKFAAKFKQEREQIEQSIKGCPVTGSNLEYYITKAVELSSELPSVWAASDYSYKQKLQHLIFPEGIYYNKKNDESRTTKINSVFLSIARLQGLSGQKNNGFQSDFSLKSVSVVPTGIEPVSKV
jgi:DNA invertase Pin-like site-specific DNA recombinase